MAFYKTCSSCGANLDPGEKCDCESKTNALDHETQQIKLSQQRGQHKRNLRQKDLRRKEMEVKHEQLNYQNRTDKA